MSCEKKGLEKRQMYQQQKILWLSLLWSFQPLMDTSAFERADKK